MAHEGVRNETVDATASSAEPLLPLLDRPASGDPRVVTTPEGLQEARESLQHTPGPVAIDAERASGYRYGHRAFLVQIRRGDGPIFLIDPTELPDLSPLAHVLGDAEWILHAANQDLPCLLDVGLRPGGDVFDTELGARLAGLQKVGLAAVVEHFLGVRLAKEHSAVDWSIRPLPADWLNYAALDVEVLTEVRRKLGALLAAQGKADIAAQEFAAVRDAPPQPPKSDPWRRTSGIHAVTGRRQLAAVRELWYAWDELAQRIDTSPGRVLPDKAIIAVAANPPASAQALAKRPVFGGRSQRKHADHWFEALRRAAELPDEDLPPAKASVGGPPPARLWNDRNPDAAARLAAARRAIHRVAHELAMPAENVLQPAVLKNVCWQPPEPTTIETVRAALNEAGAREWQVDRVAEGLTDALLIRAGRDA